MYDLDPRPGNPTNNFKFKNCRFDATSTVKNSDTEKWEFSDYGMKLMELDHGIFVMILLGML